MSFEVKVQLENAAIEGTLEAVSLGHLPLFVDDGEGDVFVGDPRTEANRQGIVRAVRLEVELWRSCLVCEFGVENVELVALDDFGRRVLRVVVRLVVLVPLVALLYGIEEARLAHHEDHLLRLEHHLAVCPPRVLSCHHLCELLLVRVHPLFLRVLEHLHGRVVKPVVVHDVEADPCVKRRFGDFLSQTQLHKRLLEFGTAFTLAFLECVRMRLLQELQQLRLVLPDEESVDVFNLLYRDF